MPKFRTMRVDTPAVATHLMKNPDVYLTPVGTFLIHRLRRLTQIKEKVKGLPSTDYADYTDELPQLYSILKGDISFVGPRPALFNQDDLVELRTGKGIDKLIPGITGWAQVNGRDELPIPVKVEFDEYYLPAIPARHPAGGRQAGLKNRSFLFDLKTRLP